MIPGAIFPVKFHGPNYTHTSKYVVEQVYDMNGHQELIPVQFAQVGPIVSLLAAPYGMTFVKFKS